MRSWLDMVEGSWLEVVLWVPVCLCWGRLEGGWCVLALWEGAVVSSRHVVLLHAFHVQAVRSTHNV